MNPTRRVQTALPYQGIPSFCGDLMGRRRAGTDRSAEDQHLCFFRLLLIFPGSWAGSLQGLMRAETKLVETRKDPNFSSVSRHGERQRVKCLDMGPR